MAHPSASLLDRFQDPAQINLFLRTALSPRGISIGTVEIVRVQHRPGAGISGLYRVDIQHAGQPSSQTSSQFYGLTSETLKPQYTQSVLPGTISGQRVWLWQHPADPKLPGLQIATSLENLKAIWPNIFTQAEQPSLELVTYRPLRRAVVRATGQNWGAYFKVMTPKRAARLAAVHNIVDASSTPAVRMLAQPMAGIVPLAQLPGVPLTNLLFRTPVEQLQQRLDPAQWIHLLKNLPTGLTTLRRRPSWTDGLDTYASAAATALPAQTHRINTIRQHITTALADTDPGPVVPTHGDFYESNIHLETTSQGNYTISGLLDLDSMGPGHLVDDLACMLGHLSVLPSVHVSYRRITPLINQWWDVFATAVDPAGLRLRTAAVVLSLVAGTRSTARIGWQNRALERLAMVDEILGPKKS